MTIFQVIEIRFRFSKNLCFVIFFAVLCNSFTNVFLAYVAAFLHELAHLAVCLLLKIRVYGINTGVFGIRLETENFYLTGKKILVSVAGPFASLVLFLILSFVGLHLKSPGLILRFSFFNLCIGAVNLIPITPLDGGAALKAVLLSRLGVIRGGNLQRKISTCLIFLLIFTYVLVLDKIFFGLTLLMVIIFLIFSSVHESRICMLEKKQVLCGAIKPGKKIRWMNVDERRKLLWLAGHISRDCFIVATVFSNGYFIGELNQSEIIFFIKESGALITAGECIRQKLHTQNRAL